MLGDDQILSLIRERADHPATVPELSQLLRIPKEERPAFRRRLKHLVATGALIETRGRHYGLPDRMHLLVGRLDMNAQGYGFVRPERPVDDVKGDLYIAGANLQDAMHGDRVVVRLERVRDDGRAEGKGIRVLERSASTVVGRFVVDSSGLSFVTPFDRKITTDIQ